MIKVAILLAICVFAASADKSFEYIHDGDDSCLQSRYQYRYNLTHLDKPIRVRYSVDVSVRRSVSSGLLFRFDNLTIDENTNQKSDEKPSILVDSVVRVSYTPLGLIEKIETNPTETDFSYHLKKGIISTLQLPWQDVRHALHDKGPLEFDTNITAKSSTCKIKHLVHRINEHAYSVTATRSISDCDNSKYFQVDYEKFRDSKKVWKYHFDEEKSKSSFHHVDITIEDFFKPQENILINSGFWRYDNGCDVDNAENWNETDLQEIHREFKPSQ